MRILDSSGEVVPGAQALAFSGVEARTWLQAESDENGDLVFEVKDEPMKILVHAPSHMPHLTSRRLARGRQDIYLPEGSMISGVVTVNGEVPQAPIKLRLEAFDFLIKEIRDALPPLLDEQMKGRGGLNELRVETDKEGRFRFRGFSKDGVATSLIHPPQGHLILTGRRAREFIEVPAGYADLPINLISRHVLSGRLVDAVSGRPAPRVRISLSCEIGGFVIDARTASTSSGRDGRFSLAVPSHEFDALRLQIGRRGQITTKKVEKFRGEKDLGDVSLGATRSVVIEVRDQADRPLSGALALRLSEFSPSKPAVTGLSGTLTMRGLPLKRISIEVGAPGYQSREVEVDATVTRTRVQLERGNHLEIEVVDSDGNAAPGYLVSLRSDDLRSFFSGRSHGPTEIDKLIGTSPTAVVRMLRTTGQGHVDFRSDRQGKVHVHNLKGGATFSLQVRDAVGNAVTSASSFKLGPTEHRKIRLVVADAVYRDLTFKILDQDGNPVPGAQLWLYNLKGHRGTGHSSSQRGTVIFKNSTMTEAQVRVDAEGFAPFHDALMKFSPDDRVHEIRLNTGSELAVRVVDSRGDDVVAMVSASFMRSRLEGIVTPDGQDLFQNLPAGFIDLVVIHGGRKITRRVATDRGQVQISVPDTGELHLSWSAPADLDGPIRVSARALNLDEQQEPHLEMIRDAEKATSCMISLVEGDYEVTLQSRDRTLREWTTRLGPSRVKITAHEVVSIRLK